MANLFTRPSFASFGPTALGPHVIEAPFFQLDAPRPLALRRRVREECPKVPGIYGMVDEHGELIYVGKAKSLRSRLLSYFRPRSRDPKAGRILKRTAALVWECWPSEFAALHRELELIRRWRPRFNVHGQIAGRRRTYLCLGRQPAPYAYLSRQLAKTVITAFGPIPAGARAREAVRRLNDWFRLRDCPKPQEMVFSDQADLFPMVHGAGCLRLEIGTCMGPCAATCSRRDYNRQVRSARAFLTGADTHPLDALGKEMADASAALAYERAAGLRDKREPLQWLRNQLDRLQCARERDSFVYPVAGIAGGEIWYVIHGGRTVAALAPPLNAANARAAAVALKRVFQDKASLKGILPPDQVDGFMLVSTWFLRYPEQREHALEPQKAMALCKSRQAKK